MRISVNKDDPGYSADARWWDVTFNGKVMNWVVTADEEAGMIVRYEMGKDGRIVVENDPDHPGGHRAKLLTESGVVVVRRMTSAPAPMAMAKTIEENFRDWEASTFGFGYGTGEPHTIAALKAFFDLCPDTGGYDYRVLEAALTPTVAWLLINVLARHSVDALEYGVSPRHAWLTARGVELKKFMGDRSAEELNELVTGCDEDYVPCLPDSCNCGPGGFKEGKRCQNPFWQ